MLRELFLKKEDIKKKMSSLWDKRESGKDWSKEERASYDELASQADKVNSDLKLRSEFVENFKMSRGKEDLDFVKSERQASLFNIIRSKIYELSLIHI